MATRFYYDPIAVPTISPTFDAAVWDQTSAAVRRCLTTVAPLNNAVEATFADLETSATNNFDVLLVQAISPPLAAQTIAGAISGQLRASETNALAQDFGHINIRAFDPTGTTSRGTLLDLVNATEHVLTTLTNHKSPISTVPTSTAILDGDILVVEIGWRSVDTAVTSWGSTISLGNGAAADLAVDESTTAANNPWIEFADNLKFMSDISAYQNAPNYLTNLIAQGTGSANAALTVTLPGCVGKKHAITGIEIKRAGATALVGTKTLVINTINLGKTSWVVGDACAVGATLKDIDLDLVENPLLSTYAGSPTILSFPAPGAGVLWSARVAYRLVP